MNKKYRVRLTDEERNHLEKLVRKGKAHARKLTYARIFLKADEDDGPAWTDEHITDAVEVSVATVARLGGSVDWRFRTDDARTKLRSLYSSEKV